MNFIIRHLANLLLGLGLGMSLALGPGVIAQHDEEGLLPLAALRTFTEIFATVKSDYVEPVSDKVLLDNAIRGMVSGLDPHSAYLTPEEFEELKRAATGEFGGLGMEISMEGGSVKVVTPIDDTPAARAGVEAGDVVIRLDGKPVNAMTLNEVVKRMRGEVGTEITLTILHEGAPGPFEITLTRAVIKVASVKSRVLAAGYGYLRISRFQAHTGEDLRDAVSVLTERNGGTLEGLVLDLRNNPGGVLDQAVAVADAFLTGGLIVSTEGRTEHAAQRFLASPADILGGVPLVVLVNGGTASAAEIVAGALKDHRRTVIMGGKTFGKGSVQSTLVMENGSALKLTMARYFTPAGRSIQAAGIVPDIVLDVQVARVEKPERSPIQESTLAGHLENEATQTEDNDDATPSEPMQSTLTPEEDFALYEALNLLQAVNLLKGSES